MLNAVVEGRRGEELKRSLGVEDLASLEKVFVQTTGLSVYLVAVDILAAAAATTAGEGRRARGR